MNFNDSIPPWLQQGGDPVRDLLAGAQIGSQIATNFSNLAKLRMASNEQDALLPLKKAEYENALASSALDIAHKQVEQQNDLETKAGVVALSTAMQGVKDWASPESMATVDSVVKQFPALALTKGGMFTLGKAQAMHQIATGADARLQTATIAADARAASSETRAVALLEKANLETASKEKIASALNDTRKELLNTKIDADMETTMLRLEKAGFQLTDHAKLAALKGEIAAINQDPTMMADPNKKRIAIQQAASKYTQPATVGKPASPAPAAATPAPQFKVGTVVQQNGVNYKFDGTNWIPQ